MYYMQQSELTNYWSTQAATLIEGGVVVKD